MFILLLIYLLADFSQQISDFGRVLHRKGGNISLMGIFNDRNGPDCSEEFGRGLEEISAVIWTVEALNKYQYIPGVTIGLTIFGVCEEFNRQVSPAHVAFSNEDNNFAVLTTPEIRKTLPEGFPNGNVVHIEHILNCDMLADATVQLLINLQRMRVGAIISDSAHMLESFKEKASKEGLFVKDEFLMNDGNFCVNVSGPDEPDKISVAVMAGAFSNILKEKICDENITLILTPTDFAFDVSLLDSSKKKAVVSIPPTGMKTVLSEYINMSGGRKEFFVQKPPTRGPLFMGAAASVLKLLKPIKTAFEEDCQNKHFRSEQPCAPVADFKDGRLGNEIRLPTQKSMKISPDDVEETLKVLKIEASSNDEMFLFITSVINANASEDLAIFQIFNFQTKTFQPILTMINDDSLTNGEITSEPDRKIDYFVQDFKLNLEQTQTASHSSEPVINSLQTHAGDSAENLTRTPAQNGCDGRMCPNGAGNRTAATDDRTERDFEVVWRFLTWVSLNTSLGFVGVTCTLSAMLFIIIRLCRDDILDGSPFFTLLLMISVIFTYFSSLPFHVEFSPDNGFICSYRQTGPPAVFAVLFSLLLSRSLILAVGESGQEYATHINGYLQSILCFFMIAVQASVISQNWIFSKDSLNCSDGRDKYKIIFALGYDFLLLILLACVSPFIIRSKQNYKEGLLFSISVFFITVVWSAWISFYVLLPTEHKDAAIAIGLNSTASVLLFCIFIPQTYFMAAPFVRNGALRSLSSLDGNILRDVNFKSTQALHEGAFGTITYKNSEGGISNPNFLTNRSNGNNHPIATRETVIELSPETSQPN